MSKQVKYVVGLLVGFIILIYFYTLLHECGHALVAIMWSGKVDKLVLGLNAHVKTSGANFTLFSQALFNVAGALLPVIFLLAALIAYRVKTKNIYYHIAYGMLWLPITSSLLAWVVIPRISLAAPPPPGDDVTKFLNNINLHPVIVSLVASAIIALLIFIICKNGLIGKLKELFISLSHNKIDKTSKTFWIRLLGIIVVAIIITAVGLNILAPQPVFENSFAINADLANKDMKFSFDIKKIKPYSMDLKLKAKGILTDIQIYKDDGNMVYQNICE